MRGKTAALETPCGNADAVRSTAAIVKGYSMPAHTRRATHIATGVRAGIE
jgi:hypothetical protein